MEDAVAVELIPDATNFDSLDESDKKRVLDEIKARAARAAAEAAASPTSTASKEEEEADELIRGAEDALAGLQDLITGTLTTSSVTSSTISTATTTTAAATTSTPPAAAAASLLIPFDEQNGDETEEDEQSASQQSPPPPPAAAQFRPERVAAAIQEADARRQRYYDEYKASTHHALDIMNHPSSIAYLEARSSAESSPYNTPPAQKRALMSSNSKRSASLKQASKKKTKKQQLAEKKKMKNKKKGGRAGIPDYFDDEEAHAKLQEEMKRISDSLGITCTGNTRMQDVLSEMFVTKAKELLVPTWKFRA